MLLTFIYCICGLLKQPEKPQYQALWNNCKFYWIIENSGNRLQATCLVLRSSMWRMSVKRKPNHVSGVNSVTQTTSLSVFFHAPSLGNNCFVWCRYAKTVVMGLKQSAWSLFRVSLLLPLVFPLSSDRFVTRGHHVSGHTTAKKPLITSCALTCNASQRHLSPQSIHPSPEPQTWKSDKVPAMSLRLCAAGGED